MKMAGFSVKLLQELPNKFWVVCGVVASCFVLPIGIGVASILVKASTLNVERGDLKINVGQVKKVANDANYANKVLEERLKILETEINNLTEYTNSPFSKRVESAFEELKPTVHESKENSEKLNQLIEQAE